MKGKIKLNENKLQSLVSECITEVLNEMKEEKKNKKINESKKPLRINESQLQSLIKESTLRILKESEMDEGFWDNMKAGWQGAKAGFNTQKMMDRGINDFKTEHDYEDVKQDFNPFAPKSENTAAEQAEALLAQAREYQIKANQLRAKANAMTKKYSLVKGVDKQGKEVENTRVNRIKSPVSGNVPNYKQGANQISQQRKYGNRINNAQTVELPKQTVTKQ